MLAKFHKLFVSIHFSLEIVEFTFILIIVLDSVSGDTVDWAYDTAGVNVTFALELRDTGDYGFLLPANQIKPAVLETWAGIKAVIEQL